MIDSMTLVSDEPRVSAILAAVALGRGYPEHTRMMLAAVVPTVDATLPSLLDELLTIAEELGDHNPDAAKHAARWRFGGRGRRVA